MEIARFIFWTAIKILTLAFLALFAAKAVSGLGATGSGRQVKRLSLLRNALYAAIVGLAAVGAWNLGHDIAAETYVWAARGDLARGQFPKAYSNALRAVELRPGTLRYWQTVAQVKFALHQFESLAGDVPALEALSGGTLEEEDTYRLAAAYYFQAQYDKVFPLTARLIREHPVYAAAYVLQGHAYMAQKKFPEAERTFLEVLQMFPTQQSAVEGLAHVYFLAGNTAGALGILNETAKYPFPPEARARIEALKALYAQ